MPDTLFRANIAGAITANVINLLLIALFITRLYNRPGLEYSIGIAFMVCLLPLTYLFITGIMLQRPLLYFFQIGLMILFMLVEFLMDYLLKIEFRDVRWMVIVYATIFFGATGGMIGVAGHAGKTWTIITVVSFFAMGMLAFLQRYLTGK